MIVRELYARLGLDVAESGFAKAANALGKLHFALEGLRDLGKEAKAAIDELLGSTASAAGAIERTARITGMSAEQIQELGYAASRSGVGAEELQQGLVHLARSAEEAAMGGAGAGGAFWRLGISAANGYGKARPLNELLTDVATKFQSMPDSGQKAAFAMEIFGRAGAQLIPLLDKGPAGIAELGAQAKKLGLVMDGSALAAAKKYRAATAELKGAFEGVHHAIAERLFPAVTKWTVQVRNFVVAHREFIALKVHEAFKVIASVVEHLADGVRYLYDIFERVWNSGGIGRAILLGLGAVIANYLIPSTMKWGSVLALIAEDIGLFFSSGGKAKTITGLIVDFANLIGRKFKGIWGEFSKDPFGFLYKYATQFFDWVVEEARKLPGRIEAAIKSDAGQKAVGGVKGVGTSMANTNDGVSPLGFLWRMWGRQISWASDHVLNSPGPELSPATAGAGGNTYNFNVQQAPGEDSEHFARRVSELVRQHDEDQRQEAAALVSKNRSR